MQAALFIADEHRRALGHLNAAMDAVAHADDTLALAAIAQAIAVVERTILIRSER